jgi:hypothetical protein
LIERIERALVLAAYVVVKHGPVYAPLLERLEKELQAARRNDPTERARRILKDYEGDRAPTRRGTRSGRRPRGPRSRRAARRRKSGRRRKKPASPALKELRAYTVLGDRKAMRFSHLRLSSSDGPLP